jgi:hypothetical protein
MPKYKIIEVKSGNTISSYKDLAEIVLPNITPESFANNAVIVLFPIKSWVGQDTNLWNGLLVIGGRGGVNFYESVVIIWE